MGKLSEGRQDQGNVDSGVLPAPFAPVAWLVQKYELRDLDL